ncbi:uncharacterized protein DNG_06662 [Cephalotrichum gorgonifer]|uniref:Uncharacterized protein n=1 Tax=Cephalotrichum gorgonifer TaxID=2041049 RepID=A0AAE8N1Z3_9PEZI|nr:uncharacterized protein DNG_06662 [Cephalotrichum gorgonifer]
MSSVRPNGQQAADGTATINKATTDGIQTGGSPTLSGSLSPDRSSGLMSTLHPRIFPDAGAISRDTILLPRPLRTQPSTAFGTVPPVRPTPHTYSRRPLIIGAFSMTVSIPIHCRCLNP